MDIRFDSSATRELERLAEKIKHDRSAVVRNALQLYALVVDELSDKSVDEAVVAIVPRSIVSTGKIVKVPGVDTRF